MMKPFRDSLAFGRSAFSIPKIERDRMIDQFVTTQDLTKKRAGKRKRRKKQKGSGSDTISLSAAMSTIAEDSCSSYSLSIAADLPSSSPSKSPSAGLDWLTSSEGPFHLSSDCLEVVHQNKKQKKHNKSFQKLFSFGLSRKKRSKKTVNLSLEEHPSYKSYDKSLTLDDPSDIASKPRSSMIMLNRSGNTTKDDLYRDVLRENEERFNDFSIGGFQYDHSLYKTSFTMNQITDNVHAKELKRGDIIFIMDCEMVDIEKENLQSFLTKYKMQNFLKRMEEEDQRRQQKLEMVRTQSTMRLWAKQKERRSLLLSPTAITLKDRRSFKNSNSANSPDPPDLSNVTNSAHSTKHDPVDGSISPELLSFSPTKSVNKIKFADSSPLSISSSSKQKDEINRKRSNNLFGAEMGDLLGAEMKEMDKEMDDMSRAISDLEMKQGAAHCMIVLQTIGSSVEVAHVTSHGGTRSFIREFDAEKIARTLYVKAKRSKENVADNDDGEKAMDFMRRSDTQRSHKLVEALGRGPPVAYRCVVYRLATEVVAARKFANEAANVAENLVRGGRVLGDPAVFDGSLHRYLHNPERLFYRFLLSSSASLFRRRVRIQFDEGKSFFNFSSSEFVALCFQRALVNKKSFDRQLIRMLDFCPYLTPPPLLQKYLHLNIDEHGDWKCCGNIFFSFL